MTIRPACFSVLLAAFACAKPAPADELLYAYEGDVLLSDPSTSWLARGCEYPCSERLENGHFVVEWDVAGLFVQYLHRITEPPQQEPSSLWVEWRFRSNYAFPWSSYDCDGRLTLDYANIFDLINTYGNAAISRSGDEILCCFELDEFHTFRFESPDGIHYWFSVDGHVFYSASRDDGTDGYSSLLLVSGGGGCLPDKANIINAWDFVRYGTLSSGEGVVASAPADGFLDARAVPFDRIFVNYGAPNYVYLDEVSVTSTSPDVPSVVATKRLDNGAPEVVEMVLDRPLPFHATTRFTLDDGVIANVLDFTYAPGDVDGDGDADLGDFAYLETCFAESPLASGPCMALDANQDLSVDLPDHSAFLEVMTGPCRMRPVRTGPLDPD